MATARSSRWIRRFLVVGASFLVLAQGVSLIGGPRAVIVVCGLYGFVLTTVFGKAYALLPSYFDRDLAFERAPRVQLPLVAVGVGAIALARWADGPPILERIGVLVWIAGVVVFLGTIAATIYDNPTGAATGTGEAAAAREPLDRLANAFVPVAVGYLLVGVYELAASVTPFPTVFDGLGVRIAHLFGPGFAVLVLFAVGYRLLPRFLSVSASRRPAVVVLPAGAVAPALLAAGYPSGLLFRIGAVLESIAIVGFALSVVSLHWRSDRDRFGLYGPLAGTLLGCLGVGLGLLFAFEGFTAEVSLVHLQLNIFGLLGVTIAGVAYQFYPPAVAAWPGAGDRLAFWSLAGLVVGLLVVASTPLIDGPTRVLGHGLTTLSAVSYCYVLLATIRSNT